MIDKRRSSVVVLLFLAVGLSALVLAACGGSSSSSSSSTSEESTEASAETSSETSSESAEEGPSKSNPVDVTMSVVMSNDVDAFLLGMEKGFFEKRGINVTLNESKSGGPEIIPALLSNHVQFGYIGVTDLAVAVDKNFKLVGIGPYDVGAKTESEKDAASFAWLKENTEIKSPADLEGKTVAINSLNGLGQMLAEAAVENAGGDPKSIKFVAINFPDMGQALTDGRVDAIWNVEPFLVMLEQEAEIERASSTYPMEPEAPVSVWTVSAEYLEKNEATVKAVQAALNESYEYATEHEEEDREVVMKATNTEESLWPKVTLQTHAVTVPTSAVETEIEAMEASGLVENLPPLEEWWKSNPLE